MVAKRVGALLASSQDDDLSNSDCDWISTVTGLKRKVSLVAV